MKRTIHALLTLSASACLLAVAASAHAQETGFRWQPEQASKIAPRVDLLFDYMLVLSALFAGGVCLLIIVFAFKYRRGSGADRSNAPTKNWKLESLWIGIPILLSLFTFVWSARLFYDEYAEPAGAININVIGQQWFWEMQHPEGPREMDELHIPVGRPIKLTLSSEDVIHDFFVPAFRIKQDVLPGRLTTAWFTATQPGRYHLFCAQYCGTQHSNMGGWIYAMEPADYERWLTHVKPQPSLAEAGEKLFVQFSCTGCHGAHAAIRAPSLEGIYGRSVPLADGSMVVVDDRYLYDSIVLPGAQVAAGYQNIMPTYKGSLTQAQLLELVAYIRSLGAQSAHEKSLDTGDATTRQAIREQQQRDLNAQGKGFHGENLPKGDGRALNARGEDQEMRPRKAPSAAMPSGDKNLRPLQNLRPLPTERRSHP